ncbi:MAG: 2-phospho-L-lactate transferase CofD family protein, partial [Eubacterium sp.]
GRVLPVTLDDMILMGRLENEMIVEGESHIPKAAEHAECKIKEIFLKTGRIEPLPETVEAIKSADIIIIGPGSLYTSVIPNLLVNGIERAVEDNRGRKFYIGNIMTQPGETDTYTQREHIQTLELHQKNKDRKLFNYAVVNNGDLPTNISGKYKKFKAKKVEIGERLEDYEYIEDDFIMVEDGRIRHDADLLARRIFEIYVK